MASPRRTRGSLRSPSGGGAGLIYFDVSESDPDKAQATQPGTKPELHRVVAVITQTLPAFGSAPAIFRSEIRFVGVGEEEVDEDLDAIVEGFFYRAQRHLIVSLPKVGKSVLAVAVSGSILNRQPFLDRATEPMKVLYLTEEGMATFALKLHQFGIEAGSDFKYLRRRAPGVSGAKWSDIVAVTHDTALEFGAGLVVVDVLHRWAGFDGEGENSSGVVSKAIGELDQLAESGIAVAILHHSPWSAKRSRGSTDILGAVDHAFFISGSGQDPRELVNLGGRLPIEWDRIAYRIGESGLLEPLGHQRVVGASSTALAIDTVTELGGSATAKQVAEKVGWSLRVAERWISRAENAGRLKREAQRGAITWSVRRP